MLQVAIQVLLLEWGINVGRKLLNRFSEIILVIQIQELMEMELLLEPMKIFLIMISVCHFHTLLDIKTRNQVQLFTQELRKYRSAMLH